MHLVLHEWRTPLSRWLEPFFKGVHVAKKNSVSMVQCAVHLHILYSFQNTSNNNNKNVCPHCCAQTRCKHVQRTNVHGSCKLKRLDDSTSYKWALIGFNYNLSSVVFVQSSRSCFLQKCSICCLCGRFISDTYFPSPTNLEGQKQRGQRRSWKRWEWCMVKIRTKKTSKGALASAWKTQEFQFSALCVRVFWVSGCLSLARALSVSLSFSLSLSHTEIHTRIDTPIEQKGTSKSDKDIF